jgi:hypothetical protein
LHNVNVLKTKTQSYSSNRAIAQVSAQNDIIISMDIYFNVLSPEYRTDNHRLGNPNIYEEFRKKFITAGMLATIQFRIYISVSHLKS